MNRWFKIILIGLTLVVAAFAPFWISNWISVEVDYVPNKTVQITCKAVIDISAALLGFFGLILVFDLKSIQSSRDRAIGEIYRIAEKQANLVVRKDFEGKMKRKLIESQLDLNKKRVDTLIKYFEQENEIIRTTCCLGAVVVAFFVVSILSSIAVMGKSMTEKSLSNEFVEFLGVPPGYMSIPLMFLIMGIIFIFVEIILIAPWKPKSPPSEAKKES